MPLVCSTSRIKAVDDSSSLSLVARHCCKYGNDLDTIFTAKSRFPDIVDVLIGSSVVFRITATLEGKKVSPETVFNSHLARHLHDFLDTNSIQLGLNDVSSVYMDSDCGTPSVTVTSSRCMPETKQRCLILSSVHLCYEWKTRPNFKPFARNLPLPGLSLLNNVLTRFVSWHLVKRYPLAFGTWHKQLDIELPMFPKILSAILAMIKRSPNSLFVSAAKRHLKDIKRSQRAVIALSESAMASWLGEVPRSSEIEITLEDAFSMSLEGCYRRAVRKPVFKSKNHMCNVTADAVDDEDLIAQDLKEQTQVPHDSLFGLEPALACKRHFQTADLFSEFTFKLPEPSGSERPTDMTAASFDHLLYCDLDQVRFAALSSDALSERDMYIDEEGESDFYHETIEASDALYSASSNDSFEYPITRSQIFCSQITSPVEFDLDRDSVAETTPPSLLSAGLNVDDHELDSEHGFYTISPQELKTEQDVVNASDLAIDDQQMESEHELYIVDLQEQVHSTTERDVDSASYPATALPLQALDIDSDSEMETGVDADVASHDDAPFRMDDDIENENEVILSSEAYAFHDIMATDSASDTDLGVPALIHSQSSHSQNSDVETWTPGPMQTTFEPSIVTHDEVLYAFLDDSAVMLNECERLMEMEMEDEDYVDGRSVDGENVDEDLEEDDLAINLEHQDFNDVDENYLIAEDTERVGLHDLLVSEFVQEDGIIVDLDEE